MKKKGAIHGIVEIADPSGKRGVANVMIEVFEGSIKKGGGPTGPDGRASLVSGLELVPHRVTATLTGPLVDSHAHSGKQLGESLAESTVTPTEQGVAVEFPVIVPNIITPILTASPDKLTLPVPSAPASQDDIHRFAPKKEEQQAADPELVTIVAKYEETNAANPFDKGLVFTASGTNVTLWRDKKCTRSIGHGPRLAIPHSDAKKGITFYLRGEKGGTADLKLAADSTSKPDISLKGPATAKVEIQDRKRITPIINVEHLVVLRDQELWKNQRKNDTFAGSAAAVEADWIRPDPTRIELSAAKTSNTPEYTGKGTLSFSPENVKAYTDEECMTEFKLSEKIDFAKFTDAGPFRLWLRGKTAGKFTAKLELDPSNDPRIKVDEPAKGEMGCVELKLKLHHYENDDVNKAINPDVKKSPAPANDPPTDNEMDPQKYWDELKNLTFEQKEMTDSERVGAGRLLHAQKDKNHARAKLIVEKLDGSQWPDAANLYQIILDAADGDKANKKRSGAVKLFTAEEDGDEKKLRLEMPLSELKSAEKTFWIEGAAACDHWRGIRLTAGFDRPDGGLAKTPKMDGNWAALSIVEIAEVKIDYTPVPDKPRIWVEDTGRFYINFKADPDGRKVTIGAKLSKELKGCPLHLMLAPHKDNFKADTSGGSGAATVEQHRADRKKLLHLSKETDEKGYAKVEVQTSRFGGDKFLPASYLMQDPHLARFVQEQADLSKRKPVVASKVMTVWRKLYCQVTALDGMTIPSLGVAQATFKDVFVDFEEDVDARVLVTEAAAPAGSIVDGAVISGAHPAKTLIVGDHNVAPFKAKFRNNKSPTAHIIFCHEQLDANAGPYDVTYSLLAADCDLSGTIYSLDVLGNYTGNNSALFFPKNLKTGANSISKCKWKCLEDATKNGDISQAAVTFAAGRDSVTIPFPAEASALLGAGKTIELQLTIAYAEGWFNGWCTSGDSHNVIKTVGRPEAGMCCTIVHECGHAINQSPKDSGPFPGIKAPQHKRYYTNNRGHQGPHCADGVDDAYYNNGANRMDTGHANGLCTCIMYGAGSDVRNANAKWCARCRPYVLGVGIAQVTT